MVKPKKPKLINFTLVPELEIRIQATDKFDAQRKGLDILTKIKLKLTKMGIEFILDDYDLD